MSAIFNIVFEGYGVIDPTWSLLGIPLGTQTPPLPRHPNRSKPAPFSPFGSGDAKDSTFQIAWASLADLSPLGMVGGVGGRNDQLNRNSLGPGNQPPQCR